MHSSWPNEPNLTTPTTRCTKPTPACLLSHGLDGAGEALRILVNQASRLEHAQRLQATPCERSAQHVDYANGYKPKTVLTRLGELTFEVPQVRSGQASRISETPINLSNCLFLSSMRSLYF